MARQIIYNDKKQFERDTPTNTTMQAHVEDSTSWEINLLMR